MEPLVYLIGGVIFVAGVFVGRQMIINQIKQGEEQFLDAMETAIEEQRQKIINVNIKIEGEMGNKMIYVFEAQTEKFLGSGRTIEEVKDNLMAEYPNKIFHVTKDDMKKLRDYGYSV